MIDLFSCRNKGFHILTAIAFPEVKHYTFVCFCIIFMGVLPPSTVHECLFLQRSDEGIITSGTDSGNGAALWALEIEPGCFPKATITNV